MFKFSKKQPTILVVGDLMVDHYIWGESTRISPEAPVQVVDVRNESNRLGGACNVANNLVAMGAKVDLCGVVGSDAMGEWLVSRLNELMIGIQQIVVDSMRPTTQKTRVILSNQQILRVDRENKQELIKDLQEKIYESIEENIHKYSAIILSDYNKGVLTKDITQKIIGLARSENIPILCDPKGVDYTKYKGATLLTPNKKEAQEATHIQIVDSKSLELAAQKMKKDCSLSFSLITLSEDGIGILDQNDKILKIPTVAKEVFDVTGAGDTVIASLAFCLAQSIDIYNACKFANAAAAVVVSKVGSAVASMDEILLFLNSKNPHQNQKIITLEALLDFLKNQNQKIIFTNGCFDILHRGHIQYLQEAKELGDILIVGLNTDASVKRLKGEMRPINSQDDRAFVLAGLESVDFVVLFDEDTPLNLIQAIQPDILVKGADYKDKEVVGSEFAGQTILIDFVEGKSTSLIIEKIKG
ncbi:MULTISPECIES: D-glycero-beta-D-manno-heptose-7-phosphate kinase [unclassified Helicobacter]|uniref:D-glycero-beta-D-manno-heptose-7-phosphate kinase n=1 Tax=unclassified Helicobacter TaxID=2593540 RepID=UPI000CF13F14|nr:MULTISPECIES: D-glycero-beta-D-manno-heptose-7-phosphate kinase [unclassified Helicobacter]